MSSLQWIMMITLAESTLMLILLMLAGVIWLNRRKRRESEAVSALMARVAENRPQRRSDIQAFLENQFAMTDPALQEQAEKILVLEDRLYEELCHSWLTRGAESLQQIDQKLNAAFTPYLDLRQSKVDKEQSATAKEIENLKASLNESTEEMTLYRNTLNMVFTEYTAMFGSRMESGQQLSAHEIIQRLKEGAQTEDRLPSSDT